MKIYKNKKSRDMWDLKKDFNHFPTRKVNRILKMSLNSKHTIFYVSKENTHIEEVMIKWFLIKMQFKPAA